jgi:VanZ family protein
VNRRFVLLLAWLTFVVYGSLVPLDFRPMQLDVAWQSFGRTPLLDLGVESRADWVANGVLYMPLGLLATRWMAASLPRLPFVVVWVWALAGCAVVAVGVEFAQLFFPPRTVSQNDLIAECIGSLIGASLVPFVGGWLDRLSRAWSAGGTRLVSRLLELYAVAYVALCFFPFDLLLSRSELHDKAASGLWGWVLASQERGLFFTVLQLAVEVVLAAPVGVLLVRLGAPGLVGAIKAGMVGLALGLLIEVGQFFIASGVSQGASALSRAMGVMVGARLAPQVAALGQAGLRRLLARFAWPLLAAYLPVLLVANGWFRLPWQGAAGAAKTWAELRLMPFYYHYWTTEAIALFSLGSVALMYLPLVLAGWARATSMRRVLAAVGVMVLFVEISKLFIAGARPDPTNLLIAIAASLAALRLLSLSEQMPRPTAPAATNETLLASPATSLADADLAASTLSTAGKPPRAWAWLFVLPVVVFELLRFPTFAWLLLPLLALFAVAVWWRPVLALALVPAALPVLDLAPWTGRIFIDEFDLLLATCLAMALYRAPRALSRPRPGWLAAAFWLLGLSLVASSARALWPALVPPTMPDADALSNFFSPWSALRILKGAAWAGIFMLLWQRLGDSQGRRATFFSTGMLAGLAMAVLAVLWERATFASLWDFSADFRVTGMFSAMHRGGAYIECYLAAASAFAAWWALRAHGTVARAAAMLLLAAASYAVMVTYSRNGYAALLSTLLLSAVVGLPWKRTGWRAWVPATGLVLALAVVAAPLLAGSYARDRLSQSGRDLGVRAAHWADALQMRDPGVLTSLIGMGLSRFPETHFWRSQEPARAATWRLVNEDGNLLLRLGAGATLYVEQILLRPEPGELLLSVDLRSARGTASLKLALCEKWGLTSLNCIPITAGGASSAAAESAAQAASSGSPGIWQRVQVGIDPARVLASSWPLRAPLKLSLLTPPDVSVDVDNLRLVSSTGEDLLTNGDFSAGMDRWFFATDIDPPWHVHNLPLAVLFDQGWLGVLAWAAVVLGALGVAARLVLQGKAVLPAAGVAVAAFLVSGTLNTLIDTPRFLWLLLVLLWLAAQSVGGPPRQTPATVGAAALTA